MRSPLRARLVAALALAIGGCGRSNAAGDRAPAHVEAAEDARDSAAEAKADAASDSALEAAFSARGVARVARVDVPADAAADASIDDGPLAGARWATARAFVARYCAECHTERGTNPRKRKALPQQRLDTYEQWRSHASALRGVLDKWNPDGKSMPPRGAHAMPTDVERRAMLDWLARGSPNGVDGR